MIEPRRILVIKLGALGDIVQALGPLAAIRTHHPQAHIVALTTRPYVELLRASPYVDEVWTDTRPRFWQLGAWLGLRARLRAARFDRVYDLQTSGRSSFYFRLMGPGGRPEWSGIADGASHPDADPKRDSLHTIERQAGQLRAAGIPATPLPDVSWLSADLSRYELPARFALLVPGGSALRPRKRWPAAQFGALARELAARGIVPAVLGVGEEGRLAEVIVAECPEARDLTGNTSLAEIAALARKAALAVGNDTGPMHLIAAAGCPSIVLFSDASDPQLCAPRGRVTVLQRPDLGTLASADVIAALHAP